LYSFLLLFGFDPKRFWYSLRAFPRYIGNLWTFWRETRKGGTNPDFPLGRPRPRLGKIEVSAENKRSFGQDVMVARRIFLNNPDVHFDVGSRRNGLVAHLAAFRSVFLVDAHAQDLHVSNVELVQANITDELPEDLVSCCDSVSSLDAIERLGLGELGSNDEQVSLDAYLRAMENLLRILKPGGKLYFSAAMGTQRVEFNARRIFAARTLFDFFTSHGCRVDRFSFVDDAGDLHENEEVANEAIASNFGCLDGGCAIFEITKT